MSATTTTDRPRREIRVGDQVIRIEPPNGWKFLEATDLIGEISEHAPGLAEMYDDFVRKYREQHSESYDKPEAIIKYPTAGLDEMPEEWWAARNNRITLLGDPPDTLTTGLRMFSPVFKVARDPLLRLITILAMPSGVLEQADANGTLADQIVAFQRQLLHQGRVTDLAVILVRAFEAMQEEFAADSEAAAAVGEIQGFLRRGAPEQKVTEATPTPSASSDEPSSTASPSEPTSPAPTSPDTASAAAPPSPASSTSSPPPTDGPAEKPSSPTAGPPSATSASPSSPSEPPAAAASPPGTA